MLSIHSTRHPGHPSELAINNPIKFCRKPCVVVVIVVAITIGITEITTIITIRVQQSLSDYFMDYNLGPSENSEGTHPTALRLSSPNSVPSTLSPVVITSQSSHSIGSSVLRTPSSDLASGPSLPTNKGQGTQPLLPLPLSHSPTPSPHPSSLPLLHSRLLFSIPNPRIPTALPFSVTHPLIRTNSQVLHVPHLALTRSQPPHPPKHNHNHATRTFPSSPHSATRTTSLLHTPNNAWQKPLYVLYHLTPLGLDKTPVASQISAHNLSSSAHRHPCPIFLSPACPAPRRALVGWSELFRVIVSTPSPRPVVIDL
ncbi:hypothetical protein EDD21DRAFT_354222 [Dissophora ornata]|nr:hypothetical protein EDD21DRAFT_354222 [Dissophora ornata]